MSNLNKDTKPDGVQSKGSVGSFPFDSAQGQDEPLGRYVPNKTPRRLKYLIGAILIGCAFLYLIWTSFSASFQFALTPGEFLLDQTKYEGRTVKLAGTVAAGSILANGMDYYFRISDSENREIKIHYKGIAPNTFREGADVVVSGTFNSESDMFESKQMLTKCASKYE